MSRPERASRRRGRAIERGIPRDVVIGGGRTVRPGDRPRVQRVRLLPDGVLARRRAARACCTAYGSGSPTRRACPASTRSRPSSFVMNHPAKQHGITSLWRTSTAPARRCRTPVGEWALDLAAADPMSGTMGAYFIQTELRRTRIYRARLERYVAMATEGGVVQAIYPEGG